MASDARWGGVTVLCQRNTRRSAQPSCHPFNLSSASTDCPPLPLKSPLVSPQARLLKTPSSPTLTNSSCQENSIRDATSVGPALGTTYRWSRTLLFLPPSLLSYVFLSLFLPFRFPSFYLAIRHSTTPLPLRLCARHHTFGHNSLPSLWTPNTLANIAALVCGQQDQLHIPFFLLFFTLLRSILVFNLFAWHRTRSTSEELPLCNRPLSFPSPFVCRHLKSFVTAVTTPFRAFSFSWERSLSPPSFSPRAFALPSGSRTRLGSRNYPRMHKRELTSGATVHENLYTSYYCSRSSLHG